MKGLVAVRLHGPLADRYGGEHFFAVSSPREAINALDANYPGFRAEFLKCPFYGVIVDGDSRDETTVPDIAFSPVAREIDFVPMIEGRIAGLLVPLLGYIGITGTAATILSGVIATGLLLGVSMLLAPKVKKPTSKDSVKDENYIFSGPENVTEQGVAVPLIYGRCFVGSVVVSAGLEVAQGTGSTTGGNWVWTQAAAPTSESLLNPDVAPYPEIPVPEPPPADPVMPGRTRPRYIPENA